MKLIFEIDGKDIEDLGGFFEAFSRVVIPGVEWGKNLDAFDEVLGGEFGTPREGFVLIWKKAEHSKTSLGYPETVRWYQANLIKCHPSSREFILEKIADSESAKGPTLFDLLVEIIRDHGAGGRYENDGVELHLC